MAFLDLRNESILKSRQKTLLVVFLGAAIILTGRLFYLQVVRNRYYDRLAFSNRIQRERVVAPRGLIRGRDGSKLVVNVPVYEICIKPGTIRRRENRLHLACRMLELDEQRLMNDLIEWKKKYPDGRTMTVVPAADKRQISVLRENRELFPFFELVMKHRREYPEGSIAAHVLGYVGEVTDEDLKASKELQPGDIIGRTGVEYSYERYLRGRDGVRLVEFNAEGTRVGVLEGLIDNGKRDGFTGSRPPVPGSDVYLTIDLRLQRAVEEAFRWERGSVIVMDPRSGEILAAVSRPTYDPNIFREGINDERWRELNDNPSKPLFNRTVQATYPPGSIFKVITAYAGLVNGVVTESRLLKPCLGAYRFGNRYFGCWKPEGHGAQTLSGAIVRSCDVYFYQVGEMLTADQFAAAGAVFGIGEKSGVDLPSEAKGILPDHRYYDGRFGKGKWTKGHLLNCAIGQGEILMTPVQICTMAAIFANGGKKVHPHVVMDILDAEGSSVYTGVTTASSVEGIDLKALGTVRRALEGVISDENGTGRAAAVMGIRIAGKTGTAQNPHGEDHALFIAFAPVERPEIVLAIVMENAGHGGAMAAPVARIILSSYFLAVAGGDESARDAARRLDGARQHSVGGRSRENAPQTGYAGECN